MCVCLTIFSCSLKVKREHGSRRRQQKQEKSSQNMSHDSSFAPPNPTPRGFLADAQSRAWVWIGVGTILLILVYGNSLLRVAREWEQPEYSHGYLIPAFAAVLLWMRREPFDEVVPTSHRWWGAALIILAMAIRVYGTLTVRFTVDYISFIPALMGVFVMVGGLRRCAGPGLRSHFWSSCFPCLVFSPTICSSPCRGWRH